MENKKIKYYIVKRKIPNDLKEDNLFYYELRHYDFNEQKYVIERDGVIVNFYGTIITDKEILNGREYIDYKHFFKEYSTIRDYSLNPFRKRGD